MGLVMMSVRCGDSDVTLNVLNYTLQLSIIVI